MATVGVLLLVWVATSRPITGSSTTEHGAQKRWVDVERSTVTVYVSASGGQRDPSAAAHVIEAQLAEGSVDDNDAPHLALVINVGELRVVDPGRSKDERQTVWTQLLGPEGLDAERFSRITYHSLAIDQDEAGIWLVQGELEMHGRFLPLNARAVRQGDRFTGTTTVVPADFGMSPMQVAGASAPVGHEVRVDFDIRLEAP
jgi:polyisoprenoid-binding protein YceI